MRLSTKCQNDGIEIGFSGDHDYVMGLEEDCRFATKSSVALLDRVAKFVSFSLIFAGIVLLSKLRQWRLLAS